MDLKVILTDLNSGSTGLPLSSLGFLICKMGIMQGWPDLKE
jgi:hypothetical protein